MNGGTFFIIVAVVIVVAFQTGAQTNFITPQLQWFAVPLPQRQEPSPNTSVSEAKISLHWDNTTPQLPSAEAKLDDTKLQNDGLSASMTSQNDAQFSQFMFRHPDYGFERLPREPDDRVSRTFNAVFKPEPIHLGKSAVFSCTIWTAIKRKNPLCLLNPIVINASW